jgi:Tuberculosis necrotizing toxin
VSQPTPLNAVEQDALVKQIGLALMKAAPQDWEQVRAEYRAAGRYFELSAEVTGQDGQTRPWTAPQETATLFARLRAGMYREGRGTWFNAKYQLDKPSSYNLDFDREEPQWQSPPPLPAYSDEMRFFPRTEDNVPEWLARRLQAPRPPAPGSGPRLRTARIFDGPGPDGRPSVNRPQLDPGEIDKILDYLEAAPVALTTQGMDSDRLAHENPDTIPIAFHTDGSWIWPAAVIFYLARYNVPPESELVQHIRANNFQLPEVDDSTRAAAAALLGNMVSGRPAPQQQPPQQPPAASAQMLATPPREQPEEPEPEPIQEERPTVLPPEQEAPVTLDAEPPAPEPEPEPVAVKQRSGGGIDSLQRLLSELNVPESAYRIGEPAPNTWYLERVDDGWQVGWYEHGFSTPMLFDDENDASAFLLGKLLLNNRPVGQQQEPPTEVVEPLVPEPEPAPEPEPVPPPVDIAPVPVPIPPAPPTQVPTASGIPGASMPGPDMLGGEQQHRGINPGPVQHPITPPRPAQPLPQVNQQRPDQQQVRPDDWPIQPLRGEPPLTLFRGKRVIELPTGVEIDRFGQTEGNLTYAGGTPFPLRSLVPDWIHRPYHVYRLQQPVQALAGVAVPWFGQPGGGTAYLLPKSIEDLISDGTLIEVRHGTPPPTGK